MEFAQILRELRHEIGLSQSELALKLGFARATINSWERSLSEPNYTTLKHIARIFDVTVDYLTGATDDYAPSRQSIHANNSSGLIIQGNRGSINGNISYNSSPSEPQRITKCPECKALKKQLATIKKIVESPKQE